MNNKDVMKVTGPATAVPALDRVVSFFTETSFLIDLVGNGDGLTVAMGLFAVTAVVYLVTAFGLIDWSSI